MKKFDNFLWVNRFGPIQAVVIGLTAGVIISIAIFLIAYFLL